MAQLVVAGRAGAARTGGGNFIQAAADQGAPLVPIATIVQVSPFSVISGGDKPIDAVGDMRRANFISRDVVPTTREIVDNILQDAQGMRGVSRHISGVSETSIEVGGAATQVLGAFPAIVRGA